jgi:hypothetical protein
MQEWTKTLLSAGIGFTAGLLSDGLKFSISRALKKRQVRRALYLDLALILISLEMSEKYYDHNHRLETSRLDVYDHYYNAERSVFYQLDECNTFTNIYTGVRLYVNEADPASAQTQLTATLRAIRSCIEHGFLDGKLLRKLGSRYVEKLASTINKS